MTDNHATISAELPADVGGDNLRSWLARTREDALDPAQPIIDPHHHLWDRRPRPDLPEGTRSHLRYLADDLMEDIRGAGHNVVDTVFVECGSMYTADNEDPLRVVGETRFVQGVAAMSESGLYGADVRCCGGIVSFADLTVGSNVEAVLRAHMAAAPNFRGIRHAHGWHESPQIRNSHHPTRDIEGLLGKQEFRDGYAVLDKLGLTFDCWGYHTQLGEVADLAGAFPGVTIVLNHCGGPLAYGPYEGQREGAVFNTWHEAITPLASFSNVVVKVGGCGMPTYGFGFEQQEDPPDSGTLAAAWQPYFKILIELFGPDRCMFESNYPVDKVSCSYASLWNAFKIIAGDLKLSTGDKNDLFCGTAARAYNISPADDLKA